jgi:diguanylate cyclase (GGDEF)-like protein
MPAARRDVRSLDFDADTDPGGRRVTDRTGGSPARHGRCGSCGQPLGSWDIDKLTGVLNRWGWDERAPEMFGYALARAQRIALLVVDVDRFKRINDALGHLTGDAVLRSVAAVLREATRRSDLVGRFGGDEFVLLLPWADVDGALTVARRIHERASAIDPSVSTVDGRANACSVSVGVACADPWDEARGGLDDLMADADTAMLAAKRRGGGRTCVAHPRGARPGADPATWRFDPALGTAAVGAPARECG